MFLFPAVPGDVRVGLRGWDHAPLHNSFRQPQQRRHRRYERPRWSPLGLPRRDLGSGVAGSQQQRCGPSARRRWQRPLEQLGGEDQASGCQLVAAVEVEDAFSPVRSLLVSRNGITVHVLYIRADTMIHILHTFRNPGTQTIETYWLGGLMSTQHMLWRRSVSSCSDRH